MRKIKRKNGQEPLAYLDDGTPIFGYKEVNGKEVPICNSPKSKGGMCQQDKIMANGRCRTHGGKSLPPGPTHPSWKTGEHSRYRLLPPSYARRFAEAMANPEWASLRNDIAFIDVRIDELAQRIEDGLDVVTLNRLKIIADRMSETIGLSNDNEEWQELELKDLRKLCGQVIGIVERGVNDRAAHAELRENQLHRKTLVETENKRLELGKRQVTAEEAYAQMMNVLLSVKTHVLTNLTGDMRPVALTILSNVGADVDQIFQLAKVRQLMQNAENEIINEETP